MNIKILAQNIVNNPTDFTSKQIEKYFEDYAKFRLSAYISSVCGCEAHSFYSWEMDENECSQCGKPIYKQTDL